MGWIPEKPDTPGGWQDTAEQVKAFLVANQAPKPEPAPPEPFVVIVPEEPRHG